MSPSTNHDHDGAPTIAEIAAVARRLRELSTQGSAADPGERAAFLAEKDALLARITDPHHDADPPDAHEHEPGRQVHTHRAHLNRIVSGLPAEYESLADPVADGAEARREQLARWYHEDTATDQDTIASTDDGIDQCNAGDPGWSR